MRLWYNGLLHDFAKVEMGFRLPLGAFKVRDGLGN